MPVDGAERNVQRVDVSAEQSVALKFIGYQYDQFERCTGVATGRALPAPTRYSGQPLANLPSSSRASGPSGRSRRFVTALQRRVAEAKSATQCPAPANPLWDFYSCGLVDESDDCSNGEDTEDELETQEWIQFQRQRAQARLASASQREGRDTRSTEP
ncbi:hypothetical protein Plhal304r1_c026g0087271 [Plasmopara halstedii]